MTGDVSSVTILLLIGIFLSFILQQLINGLNYLVRNYANVKAVIQIVFQELMIIGLLSLILFLIQYYDALSFLEPDTVFYKELFDFVHFVLFAIVLMYLVFILTLMSTASITFHLWNDLDQKLLTTLELSRQSLYNTLLQTHPFIRLFCFGSKRQLKKFDYGVAFLTLKLRFKSQLNKKYEGFSENSFSFAKYLRHSSRTAFSNIAQLHWSLWCFISALLILNYVRINFLELNDELTLLVFGGVILYLFLIILLITDYYLMRNVLEATFYSCELFVEKPVVFQRKKSSFC
ncbi:hypothetical protein GEMRC1_011807 [Eukaryota sp. GEM-RC1]